MTVLSSTHAVVSLGTSCQTASQIRHNLPLIRKALQDDEMKSPGGFFFDYLISPAPATLSFLRGGLPAQVAESDVELLARPTWTRHGIHFWHDRFDPEALSNKYNYLAGKFEKLKKVKHLTFVISNTQKNLRDIGFGAPITKEQADGIISATNKMFDRECKFLFVLNPQLGPTLPHSFGNARTYIIEHVGSSWHGNYLAWELVLRQYFGCYEGADPVLEKFEALRARHVALRERYIKLYDRLVASGGTNVD